MSRLSDVITGAHGLGGESAAAKNIILRAICAVLEATHGNLFSRHYKMYCPLT